MHKTLLSWSSGKDSAWTLWQLQQQTGLRCEVAGLFTTITRASQRIAMHNVGEGLLRAQAAALNLPLRIVQLSDHPSNNEYESAMRQIAADAQADGVTYIAFGDLFLEDIRRYRETVFAETGASLVFPLWGASTGTLAKEMIEGGVRSIVTGVDTKQLAAEFCGREYDAALLADLPATVDPCGERGEFHTFVYDAPSFRYRLPVRVNEVVKGDNEFVFADIREI